MCTHVTPQCAGGFALELMLGTVGTGASECDRCGAVGAAGVGVGAASGAGVGVGMGAPSGTSAPGRDTGNGP